MADEIESLDPAEAPGVLARFVHDLVEPLLGSLTGKDRTARQLEIVNNLVAHLMSAVDNSPVLDDDALAPPARQLLSLVDPALHGVGEATAPQRPPAPLNLQSLLPTTHRHEGTTNPHHHAMTTGASDAPPQFVRRIAPTAGLVPQVLRLVCRACTHGPKVIRIDGGVIPA